MRNVIVFLALIVCGFAEEKKPNVLLIAIDDLNDWVGCIQGQGFVKTPNIDRLAKRGMLFTNAHCQAPICGPSRASMMTGLLPSTTGIYGQIKDDKIRQSNKVTKDIIFLPEYFTKHGYLTLGKGKIFHGFAPKGVFKIAGGRAKGFGPYPAKRENWPTPEILKNVFTKQKYRTSTNWGAFPDKDEKMPDYHTAEWAVEHLGKKYDKPFFMAVGFLRPHVPWHVPAKWYKDYPIKSIKLPPYKSDDLEDLPAISKRIHEMPQMPTAEWAKKSGKWPEIIQSYLACITFVDDCVGKVLEALDKSEHAKNTIVILYSDHGYHMGEKNRFAKHSLWERATKVPLIISVPGGKNGVCKKPVGLIDLYPTLLELCKLPAYKRNEGHSVKSLLSNPEGEWKYAALTTYVKNNHAVRTERYRYIKYQDGSEELYDHKTDPNEWNNLAGKSEFSELKKKLQEHLPKVNVPWTKHSSYLTNDFFKEVMKSRKKR